MQSIPGTTRRETSTAHATGGGPLRPYLRRGAIFFVLAMIVGTCEVGAQQLLWTSQFGNVSGEQAAGVTANSAGVFTAGQIDGASLPGQISAGSADAWIRMYNSDGTVQWTQQFGTNNIDRALGVAADASGAYVVGNTRGTFAGQVTAGGSDVFVRKYDGTGQVAWTRQFGSTSDDEGTGVAVHSSGVYVVGWTNGALPNHANLGSRDAFISKLDLNGAMLWTHQFGSAGFDGSHAVAVDDGGVYVTGRAGFMLPGQVHMGSADVFVRKYDLSGTEMWTRQFGTGGGDEGFAIIANSSGVHVAGNVSGALPNQVHGGGSDAFIRKYDTNGTEVWTHQFGWFGAEAACGVAVDASGVYLAGRTNFTLQGEVGLGGGDAFIRKYALDGTVTWTNQFGSTSTDEAMAITAGEFGAYVSGLTWGALPQQASAGSRDAFISQFEAPAAVPSPEPDVPLAMNIQPEKCPNRIKVKDKWLRDRDPEEVHKHGELKVAIVGNGEFDLNTIDAASLRLEGVAPTRWDYEDVAAPVVSNDDCACSGEAFDGILDLRIRFSRVEMSWALAPVVDGEMRTLTLSGQLHDGTPIELSDCARIRYDLDDDAVTLGPAAPNPFNPVTTITYELESDMQVKLTIYDVTGRPVGHLDEGFRTTGEHSVTWDAQGIASGVYFYRLQAGGFNKTRRVILLK